MTELLEELQSSDVLNVSKALIIAGVAFALSLLISGVYIFTSRKTGLTHGFALTLVVVTTMTAIIVLFVGNNVARAFSLAGVFTLVRYRSEQTSPKDLAYIFIGMGVGLISGIGYVNYSALFAVLLSVVMIALSYFKFGENRSTAMHLKLVVPEDLNFQDAFDDILGMFTAEHTLLKVKTSDFGTMVELVYRISLKNDADQKAFIDKLRTRNGNMPVTLSFEPVSEKN